MALIGGPFKTFKWRGFDFQSTKDGEAEVEESGINFTKEASPDGEGYTTGEARVGYVQQECVMTSARYSEFKRLQDGLDGSGTATALNGDVWSINGSLDGEQTLAGGKVTVKIAGKVKLQ